MDTSFKTLRRVISIYTVCEELSSKYDSMERMLC